MLYLRETPRFHLLIGDLFAVQQLWRAADSVIHHTAGVLPGTAQRTQVQKPLLGVPAQLQGGLNFLPKIEGQ